MRIEPVPALAALALLGGCATDGEMAGVDSTWGEANRQTFAAQVIDPNPEYETAVPETSGDHAAQAIDRYRKDQVKKPERLETNKASGSSPGR
jgi:hypothetical protein